MKNQGIQDQWHFARCWPERWKIELAGLATWTDLHPFYHYVVGTRAMTMINAISFWIIHIYFTSSPGVADLFGVAFKKGFWLEIEGAKTAMQQ